MNEFYPSVTDSAWRTETKDIYDSHIIFHDSNGNVCKWQDAVSALVNYQSTPVKDAVVLYKKKYLITAYRQLDKNTDYYYDLKKIMETPIESIPMSPTDYEYIEMLHETCPDDEYICLFFFNTVYADETAYGYNDCKDIFESYAKDCTNVHTLCYLKKNLTRKKLNTIISNATLLGLNTHISVSSYHRPRRILDNLYCISAIVIDLDFYNSRYSNIQDEDTFLKQLYPYFDSLGHWPSAVTYSGHGYYLTFMLENNVNLNIPGMRWLYTSIVKKLINFFKDFGADSACSDLTRVFKVPGSVNFKTGIPVSICYFVPEFTVNISELADSLGIHTREHNKKIEDQEAHEKYYFNHKSRFTHVNENRMSDFENLLELRDYNLPHMRDLYFLYVSINCINMGMPTDSILAYCSKLNSKLHSPFPQNELERIVFYLAEQIAEDGSCKVKYTNEHIVNSLKITGEEQEHMYQLISPATRNKRKMLWQKEHNYMLMLENEHHKHELCEAMRFLRYSEYMSNSQIADTLELDVRTVKKYIGPCPPDIKSYNLLMKKQKQYCKEETLCYEIYLLTKENIPLKEIASTLNLSLRTVKKYIKQIKERH